MAPARLTLALNAGAISLPDFGRVAVLGPRAGADLSALPQDRVQVLTAIRPDHDHFAALAYATAIAPEGRYAASVICVPRAKSLARAMVAQAASVTDAAIIVDGAKTDGVEALLKDLRGRVEVSAPFSKAHGKTFSFAPPERVDEAFGDWAAVPRDIGAGFVTLPGVFSADGVDPGSAMLAAHLPERLGGALADLGGGWGYLGRAVLARDTVTALHLVEADHRALDCARRNLDDPRAQFHWADATGWQPPELLDGVVMNPPFHAGRSADPDLGRAFIAAAARILKPGGELWMVANRHLPYEPALEAGFAQSREVAGDSRFKVLHAARPSRSRRRTSVG